MISLLGDTGTYYGRQGPLRRDMILPPNANPSRKTQEPTTDVKDLSGDTLSYHGIVSLLGDTGTYYTGDKDLSGDTGAYNGIISLLGDTGTYYGLQRPIRDTRAYHGMIILLGRHSILLLYTGDEDLLGDTETYHGMITDQPTRRHTHI
jgi:hypothetical protein